MDDAFIDEESQRRPINDQVQAELHFVVAHEESLHTHLNKNDAISDVPNSYYKPFKMTKEPRERVVPSDLWAIHENGHLKKILTVLVFLSDEVTDLLDIVDEKVYSPLSMFGAQPIPPVTKDGEEEKDTDFKSGEREVILGKFLPVMQEMSNFVDRCYALAVNIIQQLGSLFNSKEPTYRSLLPKAHVRCMFGRLGELLQMLITVDSVVQANTTLHECWNYYKTLIAAVRNDVTPFDTTDSKIVTFERLLVTLNHSIMLGEVFKGCIEQNFELMYAGGVEDDLGGEDYVAIRSNQIFLNELLFCFKDALDGALTQLNTSSEPADCRDVVLQSLALYALYRRLLPMNVQPDAKLHAKLWGVQKNIPFVVLHHNCLWYTGEFLRDTAPYEIKKPDPVEPEVCRRAFIVQYDKGFTQMTLSYLTQMHTWFIWVESKVVSCLRYDEAEIYTLLQQRMEIMNRGVFLANRGAVMIKQCLVAHSIMQIPLTRTILNNVASVLECLKGIEMAFARKDTAITEQHAHIVRYLGNAMLTTVSSIKHKVAMSMRGKVEPHKNDLIAVINSLERILKGTDHYSSTRITAVMLLVEIIQGSGFITPQDKDGLKMWPLAMKLRQYCSVHKDIKKCVNTTLLYHHLHLLPSLLDQIYASSTTGTGANRLHYVFAVFGDGVKACESIRHTDPIPFFLAYRDYLRSVLFAHIIAPLSKDIETDLRLHTHTKHLDHMVALNPKTDTLKPLKQFLELSPIRILSVMVSIKREVSHYLDTNFYNLTTVALHDWKTYADMKALALEKLDFELIDSFLPIGSLDQGLDILQIMRNIHIFVSRFSYNMNMQQFIEYRSDKNSKHLSTIRIQSIAASLRQHGLGILNTTVNYTYQFLAQKFHIFNQFLFDEYIRAHLSREMRWFKKHKNEAGVDNRYPYDRAHKFVKDIRKQGVFDGNKTCLDQMRILITEIGNALGYVRMVRSASMYHCSEAVMFLPELEDLIKFESFTKPSAPAAAEGDASSPNPDAESADEVHAPFASEETQRAAKNVDDVIDTLVSNFGEGSDYFKVLVNVFQKVLLTEENDHLKTFCMLVPSLCISWVEASLVSKENMAKVVKGAPTREIYFTDDGFAMGIAYCLAILKQTKKNDALHWEETVVAKHKADKTILEEQLAERAVREAKLMEKKKKRSSWFSSSASKQAAAQEEEAAQDAYDEYQEIHTLQLTGKRLESYKREYEQLFFSMNGAAIFFRRTDVDT